MSTQQLTQIRISTRSREYGPAVGQSIDSEAYSRAEADFHGKLLRLCPESLWYHGSYASGCPRPILVSEHHQQQMQDLHKALTIAIIDIVTRWWSDDEARFPERMPLDAEEEELLKWIDGQVSVGNISEFHKCLGSWRPDFLVEEDEHRAENYRITEINARFSFNGFMHEVYGQEVLNRSVEGEGSVLVGAADPNLILEGLFGLFDPDYPLHLLKGAENGIDIHMFVDAVQRRFGTKPRLIKPDQLRLFPDPRSKSGHRLCCVVAKDAVSPAGNSWIFTAKNGEVWEEVRQVGLELHQRELVALDHTMMREVSLRCFNDMRTVLLVHDKRMLGVVRQETPRMVARGVLTPAQADVLDRGVVETVLPGSREMDKLIQASIKAPQLRRGYILKPIRSGKGDGIVFGEDAGDEEWVSALRELMSLKVVPGITCVVQRRIIPREYDLVLKGSVGRVRYPLVGTYHVVNGKMLGLGTWRASGGRIVAVSSGGSWICSVIGSG